jgi:hypothetical protein
MRFAQALRDAPHAQAGAARALCQQIDYTQRSASDERGATGAWRSSRGHFLAALAPRLLAH